MMWLRLDDTPRRSIPSARIALLGLVAGCSLAGTVTERRDDGAAAEPDDSSSPGPDLEPDGSTEPAEDAALPPTGVLPDPIRIMPLGDSLTFGYAAGGAMLEGGYRIRLQERLSSAGYNIDYVGRRSNGPQGDFDRDHESMNGASIAQVSGFWTSARTAGHLPHLVLLMAGTNDQLGITADQPPELAAEELGQLIRQILNDVPEARVVVALPPPLGKGLIVREERPARMQQYTTLVRDLVGRAQGAEMRLRLADLSKLDPTLLGDGVHPSTMQGYNTMADLWYESAVSAIEALRR